MLKRLLTSSRWGTTRGLLRQAKFRYHEPQMAQLKLEQEKSIVSTLIELIEKKKKLGIGPDNYTFSANDMQRFFSVVATKDDFDAYALLLYRYVGCGAVLAEAQLDDIVSKGLETGAFPTVIDIYSIHLYLRYFPQPHATEKVWLALAGDEGLKSLFAQTLLKNLLVKRSPVVSGALKEFEPKFKEILLQNREASRAQRATQKLSNAQKKQSSARR